MIDLLLHDPEATALVLLLGLVGATLALGLWAGRREERGLLAEGKRQAGELERDRPARDTVTTWPHLVRLELVAALVTLLVVTWWAILREVPLGPPADPGVTPTVVKAPWFFVGIQELLQYFDAWLAGAVLPAIMLLGLCALPYLDQDPEPAGVYAWRRRPIALAVVLGLLLLWLVPMTVGLLFRGENWQLHPVWSPVVSDQGAALQAPRSLADPLHLGGGVGQLLGAVLCLGPFAALLMAWPWLKRRRPWASRLGLGRYLLAGGLLLSMSGVGVKVFLNVAFGVRYLWVTPWFRI
jgi:hypothetical protein